MLRVVLASLPSETWVPGWAYSPTVSCTQGSAPGPTVPASAMVGKYDTHTWSQGTWAHHGISGGCRNPTPARLGPHYTGSVTTLSASIPAHTSAPCQLPGLGSPTAAPPRENQAGALCRAHLGEAGDRRQQSFPSSCLEVCSCLMTMSLSRAQACFRVP